MSRTKIQQKLRLTDEKHFRKHYQQPVVAMELIEMTIPDNPLSSKQKYRVTQEGKHLLKTMKEYNRTRNGTEPTDSSMITDSRQKMKTALQAFSYADLRDASIGLLNSLGYQSE